uniref:Cytochrome P450 n=1 Tax=Brassica oleracea var. oleracea TaxID=109376 RepID=A0A0D3CF84_BRAOL
RIRERRISTGGYGYHLENDIFGEYPIKSYLPFGGGPGKCISDTFASFENVVVAIAMLIRRFYFQTAPGAPSV